MSGRIHPTAVVDSAAELGDDVEIGPYCVIGPHVSIGKEANIHNSVVKNSIVEQGAHISYMVLENSLIGRNAGIKGRPETMNIGDNSWIEI